MICEYCGKQADNSAHICPHCGRTLGSMAGGGGGAADIIQGNTHVPPPVMSFADDQRYETPRYDPAEKSNTARPERARRQDPAAVKPQKRRRGVNQALLLTILAALLLMSAIAAFVLAIRLPQGHLLLMRAALDNEDRQAWVISLIGEPAAAEALWRLGEEQIDQGYITRCIALYEQAYALYPEIDGLYQRLFSLADAYEAVGRVDKAEEIYTKLYTQVDPANPLAYRYAIQIMLDQNRLFEAADLMKLAYEKTGELSFKSQREARVPLTPVSDPQTGRYMKVCNVVLSSPQGYDVYYLLNDAESELPEQGILYTEPIVLGEGTHDIRAVSVSSNMISDEVTMRYTVWFPTPSAPKSRLLTGVYDKPRRIYLYMEDTSISGDTEGQIITIYYTIDGTTPNIDSPTYTDEGFMLPRGDTTLRAVAVNQYGKVSNEYVGTYKVSGTYATVFQDSKDQFKSFTLGTTTYDQFKKAYGAGTEEIIDTADTLSGKALRVTYDWGTAWFTDVKQVIYGISTNNSSMTGPRGSKVGMKAEDVTALFRDRGQAANAKGNRSLYFNDSAGYGKYWKDSETQGRLEYVSYREGDAQTLLIYRLENGVVARIDMALQYETLE